MRTILFYPRFAVDGIRKNQKLYIPYLFTSVLMAAMFYILSFLAKTEILVNMEGGAQTRELLNLGSAVMGVFATIFLFYTNSFLIRRRKKEFGLYNILGMDKKSIGYILLCETGIACAITIVLGILCGIALSKLAELGLLRVINGEINYQFGISWSSVVQAVVLFAVIFLLIFFNSIRQVRFSNAVELIRSESFGEKPPKANWLAGLLGVLLLGGAYYLSVSIKQPLAAYSWFFIAVLMVIAGTFLIFISGSVVLCRLLQKNKRYYYQPEHFVSVSSMAFRMKRNGAGLASICILLTMVLVMISSSSCLYFGTEDVLQARYPRDLCATALFNGICEEETELEKRLQNVVEENVPQELWTSGSERTYTEHYMLGYLQNGIVDLSFLPTTDLSFIDYDNIAEIHFVDLADYNRMFQKNKTLQQGEALVCAVKTEVVEDTLTIGEQTFHIKEQLAPDELDIEGASEASAYANLILIVPDRKTAVAPYLSYLDENGEKLIQTRWSYQLNSTADLEQQTEMAGHISKQLVQIGEEYHMNTTNFRFDAYDVQRRSIYRVFGGLFFIGIMLSVIFLIAAVVIIYYKQISEGFEDQSRFEIMQKVGMTKKEIRRCINSQILLVFFLPILFAGLHIAFAFPFIQKMLMLFMLFNVPLLIQTTIVSVLLCTLLYAVIYRITSNAYYTIVSGAKK